MIEATINRPAAVRTNVALVRDVTSAFGRTHDRMAPKPPPDLKKAAEQHHHYVRVLRGAGVEVRALSNRDLRPDGPFVEDLAVVLSSRCAILGTPSALVRVGEEEDVRPHLSSARDVHAPPPSAHLDGGDVIRFGHRLFVGSTTSTNDDGVAFLARIAAFERLEVVHVQLRGRRRLSEILSPVGDAMLLHAAGAVSREAFPGIECIPAPEAAGANVLALNGRVIVAEEAPRTAQLLVDRGHRVVTTPLSEFLAAGAGPTRLSLRW